MTTSSSAENFQRKQSLCRTTSNLPNTSQQHLVPSNICNQIGQHHSPQYRLSPNQQTLSASTSPTNNLMPRFQQQQQFPKSHSIDNLPEMYQPMYNNSNSLWNQQTEQSSQQLESQDMSVNLHKKLQRQLSLLNPFDPRIYQMQRYHNGAPPHQNQMGQSSSNTERFQMSSPPAHKPLSLSHSHSSSGQSQTQSVFEHQVSFLNEFHHHVFLPIVYFSESYANSISARTLEGQ